MCGQTARKCRWIQNNLRQPTLSHTYNWSCSRTKHLSHLMTSCCYFLNRAVFEPEPSKIPQNGTQYKVQAKQVKVQCSQHIHLKLKTFKKQGTWRRSDKIRFRNKGVIAFNIFYHCRKESYHFEYLIRRWKLYKTMLFVEQRNSMANLLLLYDDFYNKIIKIIFKHFCKYGLFSFCMFNLVVSINMAYSVCACLISRL